MLISSLLFSPSTGAVLLKYVRMFGAKVESCRRVDSLADLCDGVALFALLHHLHPSVFDINSIEMTPGNDLVMRVKNLSAIIAGLDNFVTGHFGHKPEFQFSATSISESFGLVNATMHIHCRPALIRTARLAREAHRGGRPCARVLTHAQQTLPRPSPTR
jgi:hypothetical protein